MSRLISRRSRVACGAASMLLLSTLLVGVVAPATAATPAATPPAGTAAGATAPSGDGQSLGYGITVPYGDHLPTPAEQAAGTFRPRQVPVVAVKGAHSSDLAFQNTVSRNGALATFVVNFYGGFSDAAEQAFIGAVNYWAGAIYSSVPITIDAEWRDLGGGGILGSTGPEDLIKNFSGAIANTGYAEALANAITGKDLDSQTNDLRAQFNSSYPAWSFDLDPANLTTSVEDFQSVVTHEIGHGLGFISGFGVGTVDGCASGVGCYGAAPLVYDQFVWSSPTSGHLLLNDGNNTTTLAGDLQPGGGLYWAGRFGVTASNPAARPKLFAPDPWQDGSSLSHLDESSYTSGNPDALMTPSLKRGEVERAFGPVTRGMLLDMGWAPAVPNNAFVPAVYQSFLGRPPSASELSGALALLANGASRSALATGLANSTEWVTDIVKGFYANTLSRPIDQGGLAYWVNAIQTKVQTVATTAANFYASQEYYAGKGGNTDRSWVDNLYTVLLGRSADLGGETYWVGQIGKVGRGVVALNFYQSLESRQVRVTTLYNELLGRGPDGAGLAYWAGQILLSGDLALAANLAGSAEYLGIAEIAAATT